VTQIRDDEVLKIGAFLTLGLGGIAVGFEQVF
jgi:hypothetical protein